MGLRETEEGEYAKATILINATLSAENGGNSWIHVSPGPRSCTPYTHSAY